jgi:molybdate transport system substrate-binding protein
VELGEADAGIVYRTDLVASSKLASVPIPAGANVRATYAAALVGRAPSERTAAFLRFLLGARAQAILAAAGFGPP